MMLEIVSDEMLMESEIFLETYIFSLIDFKKIFFEASSGWVLMLCPNSGGRRIIVYIIIYHIRAGFGPGGRRRNGPGPRRADYGYVLERVV